MAADRRDLEVLLAEPEPPSHGHLTPYRLEQVAAGQGDPSTQEHLAACAVCRERVTELEAEARAFLIQNPSHRVVLDVAPGRDRPSPLLRWGLLFGAAVSAMAMAALFIWLRPLDPVSTEVRVKGEAALRVLVARGEERWYGRSGEGLSPGDILQLEVFAARAGYLRLLGRVEGEISHYFPDRVSEPERFASGETLAAGERRLLGQTLVLDDEHRQEWLVAIVSDRPVSPAEAEALARDAACPPTAAPVATRRDGVFTICFEITRR